MRSLVTSIRSRLQIFPKSGSRQLEQVTLRLIRGYGRLTMSTQVTGLIMASSGRMTFRVTPLRLVTQPLCVTRLAGFILIGRTRLFSCKFEAALGVR